MLARSIAGILACQRVNNAKATELLPVSIHRSDGILLGCQMTGARVASNRSRPVDMIRMLREPLWRWKEGKRRTRAVLPMTQRCATVDHSIFMTSSLGVSLPTQINSTRVRHCCRAFVSGHTGLERNPPRSAEKQSDSFTSFHLRPSAESSPFVDVQSMISDDANGSKCIRSVDSADAIVDYLNKRYTSLGTLTN